MKLQWQVSDCRLTQLQLKNGAAVVSGYAYAYGDNLNLTGITDQVAAANSVALWYDPANRLQDANGPWGNSNYYYDAVGNRTYDINTVGAATVTNISAYAANSNRITGMTSNGAALRSYSYDGAGNITQDVRPGAETIVHASEAHALAEPAREPHLGCPHAQSVLIWHIGQRGEPSTVVRRR